MKISKTILAWLDWSTFGWSMDYSLPKSLCSLFWRTIISVIAIPFMWPGHLINYFAREKDDFKRERVTTNKVAIGTTSIMHLITLAMGLAFVKPIENLLNYDLFRYSDGVLLSYVKFAPFAAICMASIISVIVGIIFLGAYFADKCKEYERKRNGLLESIKEPSLIVQTYRGFMGKYCPKIDWDEIKN